MSACYESLQCSCPRPCSLYRYKLSIQPNTQVRSDAENIHLKVSLSLLLRTTETSITYDVIDLLADIGGFVGLLLGYSLYSVFEDVKNLVTKLFKRRAASATVGPLEEVQQPQDSNGKSRRKKRQVKQGWLSVNRTPMLSSRLFQRRAANAPVGPPEEVHQPQDSNVKAKEETRQVKQGWQ